MKRIKIIDSTLTITGCDLYIPKAEAIKLVSEYLGQFAPEELDWSGYTDPIIGNQRGLKIRGCHVERDTIRVRARESDQYGHYQSRSLHVDLKTLVKPASLEEGGS